MTWKDIIKRLSRDKNITLHEAHQETRKILEERYSDEQPFEYDNHREEYKSVLRLIFDKGMSPSMAAKQPFIPRDSSNWRPPQPTIEFEELDI